MKTVAIIQARMASTRLPGKVMSLINNQPMLAYVVIRAKKAKQIDEVLIATSTHPADDAIEAFCEKEHVSYFRGSMIDVLSRYYKAAIKYQADVVIRITSDCPLIDGTLIDQGLTNFKKAGVDYLSNLIERTFPRGFDFEIFTFVALEKAFLNAKDASEREHVTPYIYFTHPQDFKILNFRQKEDKSVYQITVDTPQDLELLKILIEQYNADKLNYKQIITLLDSHPELVAINKEVKRKHYGQ